MTVTTPCGDDAADDRDGTITTTTTTTNHAPESPAGPVDVMAAAHNWLTRASSGGVVWPGPDAT